MAAFFLDGAEHNAEEVLNAMQQHYADEKICNAANVESSLQSLRSVGILKNLPDEACDTRYVLSTHGREKVLKAL